MKLKEIIEKITVLESHADCEMEISGLCYDSRKAEPGFLFIAVRGFEADGHRFISKAVEKGASAVICETAPDVDIPYILVEDSRLALALASCAFYSYPASEMKIIGVTGTSGKTTSTNLIKHIIETELGVKVGLIGTNCNMIGETELHTEHTTPESLELQQLFREMADAGCSYVVMEVSSHSLSLNRVAGIQFSTAVYTNLALDHLDFHHTMEEYAAAKKLIFSMCDKACVNLDDAWSEFMLEGIKCPVITTSANGNSGELIAKDIRLSDSNVRFAAVYGNEVSMMRLAIPGMFSVHNALTAVSACLSEGLSLEKCAEGLSSAKGVKGRVETVPIGKDYTVIIDYSHKPDSLENVLKTLRPVTKNRLITLFGCGGDRDRSKRPIMGAVAAENSDFVIVTSDNPRTEEPQAIIDEILTGMTDCRTPYEVICDRIEAIHWAIDNATPGDVILLAGKGHEDYQIIGHEKHHMDEREIVLDYLKEKEAL